MTFDEKIAYLDQCKDSFNLGIVYNKFADMGVSIADISAVVSLLESIQEDLFRLKELEQ